MILLAILACGAEYECEGFRTGCDTTETVEACCPVAEPGHPYEGDEPCYYLTESGDEYHCATAEDCGRATADMLCQVCIYPTPELYDAYCVDGSSVQPVP